MNDALIQDYIATIVSISQSSQLCIENLWQLWNKPGYHHTLSQFITVTLSTHPSSPRLSPPHKDTIFFMKTATVAKYHGTHFLQNVNGFK